MFKIIFPILLLFLLTLLWINVPPQLPPKPTFIMDDPHALYTITKDKRYFVTYFKSKDSTQSADFNILVGNSPIPLDPFLGKTLKITGWFKDTYGYRQCVVGACDEFENKSVVIDITKIEIQK